jgi:hypothetical protein
MSVTGSRIADLEGRAWRSVFQDGLWDIALGIVFLGVGLSMTPGLDRGWTYAEFAAAIVLSVAVIRVGKRRITIPRLGWVKFGPRAERRRLKAFFVPTIGVAVALALVPLTGVMRPHPGWASLLPALVVGVVAWAVLSLVAAAWGFPRLYLHALILGASFFGLELLDTGWPMLAGSAIVFATGVGYLVRFLKLYPKPSPEVASANP